MTEETTGAQAPTPGPLSAHPCYDEHQPGCDCVISEQAAAEMPSYLNRLASTAPVEASGSEREEIARLAWSFRGNDRLGGEFYAGAKPSDSPAMRDTFAFADAVIALRPQPSGETREPVAALMRKPLVAVTSLDGSVKMPLVCLTVEERDAFLALLSACPLALGGQHSGGEGER